MVGDPLLFVCSSTFDSPPLEEELSKHPTPNPKPNKLNPVLIARAVLSLNASNGNSNNLFVISQIFSATRYRLFVILLFPSPTSPYSATILAYGISPF